MCYFIKLALVRLATFVISRVAAVTRLAFLAARLIGIATSGTFFLCLLCAFLTFRTFSSLTGFLRAVWSMLLATWLAERNLASLCTYTFLSSFLHTSASLACGRFLAATERWSGLGGKSNYHSQEREHN